MVAGTALAAALIVGLQVPLADQPTTSHLHRAALHLVASSAPPLAWPIIGSAALVIPALGISQSWHDAVAPIASLTKMMTALVTLAQLPLGPSVTGPCLRVTPSDVSTYALMKVTGQSVVAVAAGESLCERDLLGGLLVHSANNYAFLLARLVSGQVGSFVALMNETARALGLSHTHYVEPSGYDQGSVSTALEQARLAQVVMRSSLLRSIVRMTSITLPVAGTVGSFTPYVGIENVIGVKSGRTSAAGGCDVLAMTFRQGSSTHVLYAVVLGQRGGNLLGPAGAAALALADSAVSNQQVQVFTQGQRVGTIGWGRDVVPVGLARAHRVWWWGVQHRLLVTWRVARFTTTVHRGQLVGWLDVAGTSMQRFALVAEGTASPPSLWQRLR